MVVADTLGAAQDAADLVAVEYEETPAVIDPRDAEKPGAPQVHPDAPGNLAVDWPGMTDSPDNEREVDRILKSAPHVARVTVRQSAHGGRHDGDARRHRRLRRQDRGLYAALLLAERRHHRATRRRRFSASEPNKLRVITEDVGGAFGMKTPVYPEYLALLVAAKKTGRPVHWMSTRSEAFMTDTQARDTYTEIRTGARREGKISRAAHETSVRPGRLCDAGRHRHQHQ